MTQAQKIMNHIKKHGSITTMDAFGMGITRLASRVYEMKKQGIEFETVPDSAINRDGETVHFVRYKLA